MKLICLDLEASGLGPGSYPIEVAWKSTEHECDNFFIDPGSVPGWDFWDDFAEEMHGICRAELHQSGISVTDACDRLNAKLQGQDVISDAWEFDSFWLRRLFEAADRAMMFRLIGLSEVLSPEELIQYRFVCKAQLRRHRAMADVNHILQAIHSVKYSAD
ncbi:hypothetical protein [Amphritea japonica]|uniref:Exonuclease domain-containing protein n=1 Tax=Amphritea japonica ATCC BAA-1530 TaxID=1278309 RepID=A0A7R6STE8_9GAMM|nr:hypothetical protein [Amphritea japonica]BBB26537.1 conserved hypothetical protein [Amphritea japonica ATCC BAA-1530]